MESESAPNKVEAIYQLREAVEAKAQAERVVETDGSAAARDALLAAQIDVEAKTQDAIEVCHECGHSHGGEEPHGVYNGVRDGVSGSESNVVHVDFRSRGASA